MTQPVFSMNIPYANDDLTTTMVNPNVTNPNSLLGDVMQTTGNTPVSTTPSSGWFSGWGGGKNVDGTTNPNYIGMGLSAVQGIGNMYMGMKQFGLAKEQLKNSKEQFAMNYGAQRTMTNNSLNDRNTARAASRQGAGSSPYQPLQLVA